jgi:hypothetical protein
MGAFDFTGCLTCGRRICWNWSAGWKAFLVDGPEDPEGSPPDWSYRTGAEDMVADAEVEEAGSLGSRRLSYRESPPRGGGWGAAIAEDRPRKWPWNCP